MKRLYYYCCKKRYDLSQCTHPRNNVIKEGIPVRLTPESIYSVSGSITVEASLVLPLFIFFILLIMSSLIMVKNQSEHLEQLYEEALIDYEESAGNISDEMIIKEDSYELSASFGVLPGVDIAFYDRIKMHPFTGYQDSLGEQINDGEEYVFVTKTGSKYHKDRDCSYIRIKISTVNASVLDTLRNDSGGKYTRCRLCRPIKAGAVFITSDGDCYHCEADCKALKRTVRTISLKEAIGCGYTPCSKCA